MWEFCDLTATSHAKMHFATETQHTDCSHHCKDFEGKEWNLFLLLRRIKKAFLRYLQKRQRMQKKLQRRKAAKVVSEAWLHCSKADARERKKKDPSSCKSYAWTKQQKKQQLNERTTPLVPKQQCGWLYSFAITYKHSNCSGNLQGIVVCPLVGLSSQKLLFISRLVIKL